MRKKNVKKRVITSSMVNQRIADHEKLCRIMQRETNKKIEQNGKAIERLEKVIMTSTGMLFIGMCTLIYNLLF
jgi:hypothetical protein|tara:strand:+ start:334 stop:552 length:219 start_codon:yes stop_codon:yes gene_type:complete